MQSNLTEEHLLVAERFMQMHQFYLHMLQFQIAVISGE